MKKDLNIEEIIENKYINDEDLTIDESIYILNRKCYRKELEEKAIETILSEVKKKDTIIELMAEQLTTPINSKEWVIEYYTKKVEEQ